jgi:hypothetical protein
MILANGETLQDHIEIHDPLLGAGVPRTVMDLSAGDWKLKVVPWIGGRIVSMVHNLTGNLIYYWNSMLCHMRSHIYCRITDNCLIHNFQALQYKFISCTSY